MIDSTKRFRMLASVAMLVGASVALAEDPVSETEKTFFSAMPNAELAETTPLCGFTSTPDDAFKFAAKMNDVTADRFYTTAALEAKNNSYLISPEFTVPAAGELTFSFCIGASNGYDGYNVEVLLGTGDDLAVYTRKLNAADLTSFEGSYPANPVKEIVLQTNVEAGTYRIAIHDKSAIVEAGSPNAATISINNITCSWKDASQGVTVTLDKSDIALKVGEKETLTATLDPADAEAKVQWSTSDEAVARVTDGVVTATGEGTAVITAQCGASIAECNVTVSLAEVVYTLALDKTELTLKEGETGELKATLTPANTEAKLQWASSDTEVATVDEEGNVSGIKKGTAEITVSYDSASATCQVTVEEATGAIEAIFSDGAVCDVFTLDGVCVIKNADADAFRALPAGIYVVNGRKLLVK